MLDKKIKVNRIKPKYNGKNKARSTKDVDQLDKNIVVRYGKEDLKKRVEFIVELGPCQVCENSMDLDYPHHAVYGMGKKDDRYLINICVECHRTIHSKGYSTLKKDRSALEEIGWTNHLSILKLQS